jgi:tRNA 2-thiouridine synthesizing protein A
MNHATTIDARDLLCPLPVLRLRKALLALPPGARLRLLATDAMAAVDVPHFCREAGHRLVDTTPNPDGGFEFLVECGGAASDPRIDPAES